MKTIQLLSHDRRGWRDFVDDLRSKRNDDVQTRCSRHHKSSTAWQLEQRFEDGQTDGLNEITEDKGSGRRSSLLGRERPEFSQAQTGTVSRVTLGSLLRDGAARIREPRGHLEPFICWLVA